MCNVYLICKFAIKWDSQQSLVIVPWESLLESYKTIALKTECYLLI